MWFAQYNWVSTVATIILAAILTTCFDVLDFVDGRFTVRGFVNYTLLSIVAFFTVLFIIYIVKFGFENLYRFSRRKLGKAKISLSAPTSNGTCESYGDTWCCLYVDNIDDDTIHQCFGRFGKIERIGDRFTNVAPNPNARIGWIGRKPISDQSGYTDIKPNNNSVLHFAFVDQESEQLVFDSTDGVLKRFTPGIFNVDIIVGGEFAGKGLRPTMFKGRVEYKGDDKLQFYRR